MRRNKWNSRPPEEEVYENTMVNINLETKTATFVQHAAGQKPFKKKTA